MCQKIDGFVNVSSKLVIVLEQSNFISRFRLQLCWKIFCRYGERFLWSQNRLSIEENFAVAPVSQQGKKVPSRPHRQFNVSYFEGLFMPKLINVLPSSVRRGKVIKTATNYMFSIDETTLLYPHGHHKKLMYTTRSTYYP